MTFSRFVYKNALRNKRRTLFTVLSIGSSLLLLITLKTVLGTMLNPPQTDYSVLRLAVQNKIALSVPMPLAYEERMKQVPNVNLVMPLQWFGGYWKDTKNFFANFATDPERIFQMFPEFDVQPPEAKELFKTDRKATLVGTDLMTRFGWKVGDVIVLQGQIFPVDMELKIVGTYQSPQQSSAMYFNFYAFNQALGEPNTVGAFWLQAANAEAIPGIIDTVDKMFYNSPAETKTQTEKAFQLGFTSMLGNIQLILASISGVVLFTMLLVAASTMGMTIRERIREIGVLKSMGYPRRIVLMLVLGEAVFVALLGVAFSFGAAWPMQFLPFQKFTQGFIQNFNVSPVTYLITLAIGIGIGIFSGILPAIQASRIPIIQALRRLD